VAKSHSGFNHLCISVLQQLMLAFVFWALALSSTHTAAMKLSFTGPHWTDNPDLHYVANYAEVFLREVEAFHSTILAKDISDKSCRFLDVGGRNGESKNLAKTCEYWIVDTDRMTNESDHVLGCDIQNIDACQGLEKLRGTFDVIHSRNCFEHLREPWEALRTIGALAKPRALLLIAAPFAWRYHNPGYGDYLRYSSSEYDFLASKYGGFTKVESGYDARERRTMTQGKLSDHKDLVEEDKWGGWLESIESFYVGRRDPTIVEALQIQNTTPPGFAARAIHQKPF